MRFFLEAFCLDESKEKPDHGALLVGPFDGVAITWDFLRGFSGSGEDHQFIHHENGYWYPVVLVPFGEQRGGYSTQADPTRGRYTDIAVLSERDATYDNPIPTNAARYAEAGEDLAAAWAAENQWMQDYTGE